MVDMTIKRGEMDLHEVLSQDRLYVAVDILFLTVYGERLRVLVSKRTQPPFAEKLALPGRLVEINESAETAVNLLAKEMLNIGRRYMEQLYTFTDIKRDPRGRVISISYLIVVPWTEIEALPEERKQAMHLLEVTEENGRLLLCEEGGKELHESDLAFDHWRIIRTGIQRIRGKLNYTPIGFAFVRDPNAFSLSEVQTIYEAILGKPQDPSNFRRQILKQYEMSGAIRQTEKTGSRRRGRPAVLYQWNDRGKTEWQKENI
jgi:8-oxo-dGTP diphosphatase